MNYGTIKVNGIERRIANLYTTGPHAGATLVGLDLDASTTAGCDLGAGEYLDLRGVTPTLTTRFGTRKAAIDGRALGRLQTMLDDR